MLQLPWDDRPPTDPVNRLGVQVYRLQPGQEALVRLLGPWRGLPHHWTEQGRSRPCLGAKNDCHLCPDPHKFWEGYAPALHWVSKLDPITRKMVGEWNPIVFPIIEPLADQLKDLKGGVAGLVIQVRREKGRRRLHSWDLLERSKTDVMPFPEPFDVLPILFRMWRIRQQSKAAIFLLSDYQAGVERPNPTSEGEAQLG